MESTGRLLSAAGRCGQWIAPNLSMASTGALSFRGSVSNDVGSDRVVWSADAWYIAMDDIVVDNVPARG